jgi:hypothetical protein
MNNSYSITGVIYSKPIEKKQGKKDATKTYEFRAVVLEVDTVKELERVIDGEKKKSRITKKELVKLELASWLDLDNFDIGNSVEIDFFMEGTLWKNPRTNEEVVFTKPRATFAKMIDRNGIPHAKKEEVADSVFVAPRANEDNDSGEENFDLPF